MKKTLLRSIFAAVALLTTGLANAQTEYQYTFSESRATVEGEKTLTLEILDADARETKLTEAAVVTFSAMEGTKTTAVEGTDYELSAKTVTIPAGENKATITVKVIGTITEANNSLRLQAKVANTEKQTFVAGDNRYITLTLSAEVAEEPTLSGTWQMHQLVTDKAAMDAAWGGMATYGDAFPAFNAEDKITFTQRTLEPALQSTFKNFFTGKAFLENAGTYTLRTGVGAKVELNVLKVTGVNRNFDANSQSESNVAYVGYRIFNDADSNEELLDVYLIDYQSTSFASELADYGMYAPDGDYPYVAYMSGMYINFTMKRVAEVPASIDQYAGAWKMTQLVTDKAAMDAAWGGMATYGDAFPAFNAQDWMVINSNTLEPYFASTFKNFFTGEAQIEVHGKYTLRTGVGAKVELDVLKVTGVNRNFDANSQSESNVAYVGFRLFNDTDGGKELLDVYLIDYQSTSFASELADYGMYGPDGDYPYMATMTGMYINFTMERTATDIEGVEAELPAVAKGIYNLQGQKLQKLQRGVNIVNGKKVVVK